MITQIITYILKTDSLIVIFDSLDNPIGGITWSRGVDQYMISIVIQKRILVVMVGL